MICQEMMSYENTYIQQARGRTSNLESSTQDKTKLWTLFGRDEKAGRELFSLYNAGGLVYPKPKQKKWDPIEAAKSQRVVKSSPQKTKIEYPLVKTRIRPPPKLHPVDMIKRRKPQTLIQKEIDEYYRKPDLPPKKGVDRAQVISNLQTKFDKESGVLPKMTQLPPIKNFRLNKDEEEELRERALAKIPQSKLMFVDKGIPNDYSPPQTKKTKKEIDKELEDMYTAVEQEIMDRQKFLEDIAHLDEPKLKAKVKAEIVERIAELEKIIKMLKEK